MPIRFIVNNSNNNNAGWEREKVFGYKTNKKTFEKPTKENVKYKPKNLKIGACLFHIMFAIILRLILLRLTWTPSVLQAP